MGSAAARISTRYIFSSNKMFFSSPLDSPRRGESLEDQCTKSARFKGLEKIYFVGYYTWYAVALPTTLLSHATQ